MSSLRVGVAQVDYTPQIGLPLMGNFRDDYAARGVHDPLNARAMVFADGNGAKIAMLSVDICMMDRSNVSIMRQFISSQCDIAGENILIAGTHTHSGPAPTMQLGPLPKTDDSIIESFLKKAASAVIEANKNLEDASLAVGYSSEDRVGFNRRLKCKDGKTHMNWEGLEPDFVIGPLGPIDPQLITLAVQQQGKIKASIVNFALHPAILAGDNWLYSADYPGYLSEAMRRIFGKEFITAFFNGCCGNVNHIDYTDKTQGRGYQMTQRVGYMLAVTAQEATGGQVPVEGEQIAISSEKVLLERQKISEEKRKWCEEVLEKAKDNPTKGQVDGLPDEFYAHILLGMYEKQQSDDPVEVMAIRIGDVGIVGLPGEMFCEFGMEIKKNSPARHTLVFELANDAIGYLPTKESFEQGGYEPTPGSTRYVKGSGDKLTKSALKQLNELFK